MSMAEFGSLARLRSGCRLRTRAMAMVLAGVVMIASSAFSGATAAAETPQATRDWPASGRLVFDVMRGKDGLKLGEARHRWQQDGTRYEMSLALETTGLAAMLYSFQYVQTSRGRIVDGVLQPERFEVTQSGRQPEQADFDWQVGTVRVVRKGKETVSAIRPGDQDVLSVWHLAALLADRALPAELLLVTNRRATSTAISAVGQETVQVPAGRFETRRIRARASTGKLNIDLWVSPQHHGVPVRLLLVDDKGQTLDLQARSFEFDR